MAFLLDTIVAIQTIGVEEFVAKEKFIEGRKVDGVSIICLGGNFKKILPDIVEYGVKTARLKIHTLLKAAVDFPPQGEDGIVAELGREYEITLAHFFQILAYKQKMKDFTWVIGYIRVKNVPYVVYSFWYSDSEGWYVDVSRASCPHEWQSGFEVAASF